MFGMWELLVAQILVLIIIWGAIIYGLWKWLGPIGVCI